MVNSYFYFDMLSMIMLGVVWTIGAVVIAYARHYMQFDRNYRRFMCQLLALVTVASILFTTNNSIVLVMSWCLANILLIKLMSHKERWQAARASAALAFKTLSVGALSLAAAMSLLAYGTGSFQLSTMIANSGLLHEASIVLVALCLVLTAMVQAGLWPFHKWLISSLNSPTPVSAIMHAGLVNGSGYLLIRFSSLYIHHAYILDTLFIIGSVSALVGTAFKLVQSDVKRMLACSTMGQMGFMTMLCGLGLFPFAIAHLVLHALFKANLFLSANQTIGEVKQRPKLSSSTLSWLYFPVCLLGSFAYIKLMGLNHTEPDGRAFIAMILFFMLYQLISLSNKSRLMLKLAAGIGAIIFAIVYAEYTYFIEKLLSISIPESYIPLGIPHYILMCVFVLIAMTYLLSEQLSRLNFYNHASDYLYVKCLNASQPDQDTVTVSRSNYQF